MIVLHFNAVQDVSDLGRSGPLRRGLCGEPLVKS